MLSWIRRNAELRQIGRDLYERIVAQSRRPAFYSLASVPDTMEGRFEMIVLHLFLVLDRLKTAGQDGQKLGQRIMENLVADMDDALRQIGIGDMGVPRRIQKTAAAMRERVRDYDAAIGSPGTALEKALATHIYQTGQPIAAHAMLARYVRAARTSLHNQATADIREARLTFPEPESTLDHEIQMPPSDPKP